MKSLLLCLAVALCASLLGNSVYAEPLSADSDFGETAATADPQSAEQKLERLSHDPALMRSQNASGACATTPGNSCTNRGNGWFSLPWVVSAWPFCRARTAVRRDTVPRPSRRRGPGEYTGLSPPP